MLSPGDSYKGNVMSGLRKNQHLVSALTNMTSLQKVIILPFSLCMHGITVRELVALGYFELIMEDMIEYQIYPYEPVSLAC